MSEKVFLEAVRATDGIWEGDAIDRISSVAVPDGILGRRRSLLRTDVYRQWAKWFLESLVSPDSLDPEQADYIAVYNAVLSSVRQRFSQSLSPREIQALASSAARSIFGDVSERRATFRRSKLSRAHRMLLLELAGTPPRCWICGYAFRDEIVDAFVQERSKGGYPAPFVDVLRPRGLYPRDQRIEIDHVVPFAHGGREADNLRLACGWCNAAKSNAESLYDVSGMIRQVPPNNLGIRSLPQPFWIVRVLGTVGKCESSIGCEATSRTSELTLVPCISGGALNPSNLKVTCFEHDPMCESRLQSPSVVKKLWGL